eukprot:PhF_6_TR35419/c0_g1_i2/m.51570
MKVLSEVAIKAITQRRKNFLTRRIQVTPRSTSVVHVVPVVPSSHPTWKKSLISTISSEKLKALKSKHRNFPVKGGLGRLIEIELGLFVRGGELKAMAQDIPFMEKALKQFWDTNPSWKKICKVLTAQGLFKRSYYNVLWRSASNSQRARYEQISRAIENSRIRKLNALCRRDKLFWKKIQRKRLRAKMRRRK